MKVGFIGLGTMGAAMARNILKAGHDLVVYNRTRSRAESLIKEGAAPADSPKAASLEAEVIVTCVSDTPDLEAVVLGDDGILNGARPGALLVDCSTVSPEATRELGEGFVRQGNRHDRRPCFRWFRRGGESHPGHHGGRNPRTRGPGPARIGGHGENHHPCWPPGSRSR